mmetsp:Transcript_59480/g.176488  ORF Transcript_59480/g.176488 Transcript_59480/m.176488 type:complete len:210 (+) Transcript_59480:1404-2033(+)
MTILVCASLPTPPALDDPPNPAMAPLCRVLRSRALRLLLIRASMSCTNDDATLARIFFGTPARSSLLQTNGAARWSAALSSRPAPAPAATADDADNDADLPALRSRPGRAATASEGPTEREKKHGRAEEDPARGSGRSPSMVKAEERRDANDVSARSVGEASSIAAVEDSSTSLLVMAFLSGCWCAACDSGRARVVNIYVCSLREFESL